MYVLPPGLQDGGPKVTGISCPECGGVLMVRTEGRENSLVFECRIGHTLDVPELLAAKEERVEEHLWSAYTALHELVAFLEELVAVGAHHGESSVAIEAYRERAARAKANAGAVRTVVQASRPVDLAPAEPSSGGTGFIGGRGPTGGAVS